MQAVGEIFDVLKNISGALLFREIGSERAVCKGELEAQFCSAEVGAYLGYARKLGLS